jgi:hypothetical protein
MPTDQKFEKSSLPLGAIRTDGGTQSRLRLDDATVDEYAEVIRDKNTNGVILVHPFPAVVAFHDGKNYWLADGFHRLAAYIKAGMKAILAEVRQGTKRDAILYAAGANAHHGLRRTNEDKRIAVMRLLTDEEWTQWSDREIARRCGVSNNFVSEVRRHLSSDDRCAAPAPAAERTVQRGGSLFTMNTANIGKADPAIEEALAELDRPVRRSYPHSDRIDRLNRLGIAETTEIHNDGGIRALLAEEDGWNWKDVPTILSILESHIDHLTSIAEEIRRAVEHRSRGKSPGRAPASR